MTARLRLLLTVLLVAAFVGGGSSAAWALWTASASTTTSVAVGRIAVTLGGTDALTTAFSSTTTTATTPVTVTNTGTIAGTASTTVSVLAGGSTALARAVDVRAWPVGSTGACTASTAVASGAVVGTWASLPSLTSKLSAGGSTVWCIRSTPGTAAPAASRVDVALDATLTNASWTTGAVRGTFSLTTAAAAPALVCTDHSGNYVDVAWDAAGRSMDTWYGAFVRGVQIGDRQQSYFGRVTIAPNQIPASVATSGTVTVDVFVLDSAGNRTTTNAGTGTITLFTQNNGPAVRCGS
ncbi:hypothetical protein [Curtobacterium herbarum]|uniref:Uncharacterized protein n=1 Tax=Curtobacterium herbarum TaxID=150122 RepID=A0ABN1ZE75_9MICO|nr:hypothetical protein [Curtobacterium herbarum]MBM7474663.1 hypothetical protein [Curtobacterium herbarum]MCS6545316.1 hypothetical protein [Curtobacterium herbarum]